MMREVNGKMQEEVMIEPKPCPFCGGSADANSGRVTAKMLTAATRAILKVKWELAGEHPEDAALIVDSIIDGIADGYEDDVLAARMSARAAFEAIGLTVEG